MKILPVKDELFHADRRTDRHEQANSRFSKFYECAKKNLTADTVLPQFFPHSAGHFNINECVRWAAVIPEKNY